MVNVWISPEGEVHSTTLTEVHFDLARKIARKRYGWTPTVALNPLDILFRDGWVRISDGNMEAQPEALERHWDKIREFLESELFRRGDSKVWIDTVGPQGYPVVTTSYMLKELVESGEPPRRALVIPEKHESIISIREFFGRRPVRVRRYRRRH